MPLARICTWLEVAVDDGWKDTCSLPVLIEAHIHSNHKPETNNGARTDKDESISKESINEAGGKETPYKQKLVQFKNRTRRVAY